MSVTIIPLPRPSARRDKFDPTDRRILLEWQALARAARGWCFSLSGDGLLIATNDEDGEWIGITRDDPYDDPIYLLAPESGVWTLIPCEGSNRWWVPGIEPGRRRTFKTIRRALRAIYAPPEWAC
jgi:hypothetical protein